MEEWGGWRAIVFPRAVALVPLGRLVLDFRTGVALRQDPHDETLARFLRQTDPEVISYSGSDSFDDVGIAGGRVFFGNQQRPREVEQPRPPLTWIIRR